MLIAPIRAEIELARHVLAPRVLTKRTTQGWQWTVDLSYTVPLSVGEIGIFLGNPLFIDSVDSAKSQIYWLAGFDWGSDAVAVALVEKDFMVLKN
jgi:hypothetical protein